MTDDTRGLEDILTELRQAADITAGVYRWYLRQSERLTSAELAALFGASEAVEEAAHDVRFIAGSAMMGRVRRAQ